jgi:hypothetical protein
MYLKSRLFGLFLLVLAVAQGPFLRANTIVNYGTETPPSSADQLLFVTGSP